MGEQWGSEGSGFGCHFGVDFHEHQRIQVSFEAFFFGSVFSLILAGSNVGKCVFSEMADHENT